MRRKHVIISSFFIAFLSLGVLCYGSYRHAEQVAKQRQQEEKKSAEVGKTTEKRTTSKTKYEVEKYYSDSEEVVKEERNIPPEYVGVTREELEENLYKETTKNQQKKEEEIVSRVLVSFSEKKIVIRNTYKEKKEDGFVLKICQGEVAVYDGAGKELYEMTGINEKDLRTEDLELLRKGYFIANQKELYSILENFSS